MAAGFWSFQVEAGATWERELTWRDEAGTLVPLVGLGARMQIRAAYASTTPALEISTTSGGIVLQTPGVILLSMTAAQTTALGASISKGVYDLELTSGTGPTEVVTRLLQGSVSVRPEVTRP